MGTAPASIRSGKTSMKPSSIELPVALNRPRTGMAMTTATIATARTPRHDGRRNAPPATQGAATSRSDTAQHSRRSDR